MDTSQQVTVTPRDKETSIVRQRQRPSLAEKRRVVEETLVPGASVSRAARARGVNANQLFSWRRLYLAGGRGEPGPGVKFLPVRVSESLPTPVAVERTCIDIPKPQSGTIHL